MYIDYGLRLYILGYVMFFEQAAFPEVKVHRYRDYLTVRCTEYYDFTHKPRLRVASIPQHLLEHSQVVIAQLSVHGISGRRLVRQLCIWSSSFAAQCQAIVIFHISGRNASLASKTLSHNGCTCMLLLLAMIADLKSCSSTFSSCFK